MDFPADRRERLLAAGDAVQQQHDGALRRLGPVAAPGHARRLDATAAVQRQALDPGLAGGMTGIGGAGRVMAYAGRSPMTVVR